MKFRSNETKKIRKWQKMMKTCFKVLNDVIIVIKNFQYVIQKLEIIVTEHVNLEDCSSNL